jgi:DNA-3-methyladenine glycosylase
LCRALGIDRSHDGLDLTRSELIIREGRAEVGEVRSGPRIGIRLARTMPYRFWLAGEPAVSGPRERG